VLLFSKRQATAPIIDSMRRNRRRVGLKETDLMDPDLETFVLSFARFVALSLLPVILVAFFSIPLALGHHPGESQRGATAPVARHMT
jgi:hypothetical protein